MAVKIENRTFKLTAYLVLITVIAVELFLCVWRESRCVELGRDVLKARKEGVEIKRRMKSYEAELGYLKSPHRILKIAQEELGLVVPTLNNVVVVPDGNKK